MDKPGGRRWPKVLGIVAAVVVLVVVVGVLALDRILLSVARKQAATYSQELQRPIALQGIATKLWGGLGVKVTGLSVGPGPGEQVKLLELERAEVSAALLRAVRTGGKEIEIHEAVVRGLHLNVEKLPDGTTNLDRLSRKLKERPPSAEPKQPAPAEEGKPGQPLQLEVGRAAVEEARLSFVDRTLPGSKELTVDHLDAEVRDLRSGKPLELVVKAAVLAPQQNLELRIKAAPLPPSLSPTPEQVTLKVQPIDLAPLAPFLPKGVGLQGGRFQADLQAVLGAAVEGGKGPTKVLGGFKATQLAFAGQGGGKKLDASLDADLVADAAAGDLSIQKLELTAGPAGITGRGKASGLRGSAPRVEGLELTARNLDPAALAEYYPPLKGQLHGAVVAGPIGLTVRGQGTAQAQRLELKVDLTPVRLQVPKQLEKAAGAPMTLTATADAAQGGGQVRFEAAADLAGVDLRPGGTLAKKPGDPLSVKAAGTYKKTGDGLEAALTQLVLNLLGDPLQGKGQVALAAKGKVRTTRFQAELSGDRLDLDRLLLPAPKEEKARPAEKAEKPDPAAYAGLSGEARLQLGLLRMKGQEARDVQARVTVKEDLVTLEQATLKAFGGTVDASGTQVRLAHPDEPFKLVTKLKGVQAQQALGLLGSEKLLSGALDLDLDLSGPGLGKSALKALSGGIQGQLRDGAFHGKDLVASVAAPLADKLPFARKLAGGGAGEGGSTSLGKDLPFGFQIADGVARLQKPLSFETGQGKVDLAGAIGLDGTLKMPATVALSPDVISRLTGGKIKPGGPIPLTFQLAGAARSPRIEGLQVDEAAKSLASQAASGALQKALGLGSGGGDQGNGKDQKAAEDPKRRLQDEAAKKLKGLFGK